MRSLKKACGRNSEQREGGATKRECRIKESLRRGLDVEKDPRGETPEKLSLSVCLQWTKL